MVRLKKKLSLFRFLYLSLSFQLKFANYVRDSKWHVLKDPIIYVLCIFTKIIMTFIKTHCCYFPIKCIMCLLLCTKLREICFVWFWSSFLIRLHISHHISFASLCTISELHISFVSSLLHQKVESTLVSFRTQTKLRLYSCSWP